MSDTPRTEAEVARLKGPTDDIVTVDANFACELERELNRACEMYRKLDIHTLNLVDRIRRLEEAGDAMAIHAQLGGIPLDNIGWVNAWREAKEAKL